MEINIHFSSSPPITDIVLKMISFMYVSKYGCWFEVTCYEQSFRFRFDYVPYWRVQVRIIWMRNWQRKTKDFNKRRTLTEVYVINYKFKKVRWFGNSVVTQFSKNSQIPINLSTNDKNQQEKQKRFKSNHFDFCGQNMFGKSRHLTENQIKKKLNNLL